ncbi:MAG: penicillin acylase family protein [Nocardioidaceae bacterium]|nr:penicillin acylase family protein [Nocardioidaceae bacterium]
MISRDALGIAHIQGADVLEVAREQGRAIAHDRAWQLEVERRRAEGTCAEIFGVGALEWDRLVRRSQLPETARRAYAAMSTESQAFVDAYVVGVNQVTSVAQRWHSWTPLGVFAAQHLLFSRFPTKLWQRHVQSVLGEEAAAVLDLLRAEGMPGGSNAIAVAGGLSASGLPILAGDPHRVIEAPGCYAQVRLVCADPHDAFDVAGLSFVGVPGIQHFGHAGAVAWGVTNAVADDEDIDTAEMVRRDRLVLSRSEGSDAWNRVERRVETIRVRTDTGTFATEDVEILVTERGPVVLGGPEDLPAFSLRTPAWVLGNLGFDTLLPLLRARTVADVTTAFEQWVGPVDNLLVADTTGQVEHRVVGRVPQRALVGRWVGWVEHLPQRDAADHGGVLVSANDRADAEFARIGNDFAPAHRATRIAELVGNLAARGPITPEALALALADDYQSAGQRLLAGIADVSELSASAERLRTRLLVWDRRMAADSVEAACFAAVRAAVVEHWAIQVEVIDGSPYGALFAPWFDVRARIRVALPRLLAAKARDSAHQDSRFDAPEVTIRGALEDVSAAMERTGDPPAWGASHQATPLTPEEQFGHAAPPGSTPPRVAVAGDDDCVLATRALGGVGDCVHGPVARWVWDLAGQSSWVVPLGASGDPASAHHHDQQQIWAAGGTMPLVRPTSPRGQP